MTVLGYLPKLNTFALTVFLIAVGTLPAPGRAQIDVDPLRELGYEVTHLGMVEVNGELCRRLQLDNVPGVEMPFPKMIMLVRETDNRPLQVDYYDDQGRNIKTLRMQSIERINGVPMSMKMTMKNHLDGTETNIDLNINYEE
ncbi:MAG: outer membrane lipoprotein-sorting protein [Fidelibacterota bacterium]|nr:MAG: outer membrane lipoprotein-sorting protein [Candidatus Neomarinimicrobiota bacterium]